MKSLLILAAFSLTACQIPSFPKFPDIKYDYFLALEQDLPVCVRFKIITTLPYKIGEPTKVPLKECEGLGGYLPKDRVKFLNWTDDVQRWGKERSDCLK